VGREVALAADERAYLQRLEARLDAAWLEEDARYLESDLKEFLISAWHIIEPTTEFKDGWHIDAICEHLEALARGEIRVLYITMPPGHMKTGICSVVFPAWLWCKQPGLRLLTACYSKDFAERDANAAKMIVESDWYQKRWPLPLRSDTQSKARYENAKRGYRVTTTTGGRSTGEGGGLVIIDDPISMTDIWSPAARLKVTRWWSDALPSRIRNHKPGAIVMVGQRGHNGDPIGHALKQNLPGAVHLNLPAWYDPKYRKDTRWFKDPRTKIGQLLWPAVYGREKMRELTAQMSKPAIDAQYQQLPHAEGGSIIRRDWWRLWDTWELPVCSYYAISVDPSLKDGDHNDPWACQVWGVFEHVDLHPPVRDNDPWTRDKDELAQLVTDAKAGWHMILLGAWTQIVSYPEAMRRILQLREDWTIEGEPPDCVLIEDKAAGPILIRELTQMGISGIVGSNPEDKNKGARAHIVSNAWYSGRIWVPTKKLKGGKRHESILPTWAEQVVLQCEEYPAGDYDDHLDAATQCVRHVRELGFIELDTDTTDTSAANPEAEERRESAYG
jgi:predicted phage terminase large subunit-like protein